MLTSFGSNIVLGGSSFIISLILARVLGPEGKGLITALILWPTLLFYVCSFGFDESNLYQAAQDQGAGSTLIANSLLMLAIVTPLALAVGLIGLPLFVHSENATWRVDIGRVALLGIPLLVFQGFASGLLRGWQRIDQFNIVVIVGRAYYLLAIVFAVFFFSLSVRTTLLIWVSSLLISSSIAFIFLLRTRAISLKVDRNLLEKTLAYGIRTYPGVVGEWINMRLGQLLVAAMLSAAALGIYSIAVMVSESLWLASYAMAAVVFPVASSRSAEDAAELTARAARVAVALLLAGAVLLFVFSAQLIAFLVGSLFAEAIPLLRFLVPGAVLSGIGRVVSAGLKGTNRPLEASRAQVLGLLSALVVTPPLVFGYGLVGAVVASNIGYSVYFAANTYFFVKGSDISLSKLYILRKGDLLGLKNIIYPLPPARDVSDS